MLDVMQISKTFFPNTVNEKRALVDVDLRLADGDFVTVIGSNGAGKSTLLNAVSGRLPVDSGDIVIDGRSVRRLPDHARAKYIGRVFQDPMAGTAPDLSIEQNLALALQRGKPRGLGLGITKARRERFREELVALGLGLEDRLTAKVGLLSGGQRQALSLLMAGFTQPAILLLD
ncbi:MAG: ATP-binding cassette domain-containing protein, partial [Microbacteriaceae bacterium]|nr:ATP-binding cassette domain-containing protein [Microbacteriaceae bacterium]